MGDLEYTIQKNREQALREEIAEREKLLEPLCKDLWLYNMQKQTLDSKKKELAYLEYARTGVRM